MSTIPQIHNAVMSALNTLVGWTDVKLQVVVTSGNPITRTAPITKNFTITALISKNESAYQRAENTNNKDFKLCKIFKSDIEALNTTYSVNIPTDYEKIKQKINIEISDGLKYQITAAGSGSYRDRSIIILEIERMT